MNEGIHVSVELENAMLLDTMTHDSDQSIYEPVRLSQTNAPPKRFFRAFWRSLAMKMLAINKVQARRSAADQHSPSMNSAFRVD